MKYLSMALLACATVATLAAQQPVDPAADTHVKDNASFGNKKPPKRDKNATTRTVSGHVTDEAGDLLQGAMVTLTNRKTNEKTTFFTKKDGRYRFEDLSFTNDYDVQARYKTFASDTRKLSQFDKTPLPVRILEINIHAPAPATAENTGSPQPNR